MKPRNFRDHVNARGRNQRRSTRAFAGGHGEPTIQDPWVSSVPREIVITGPTQLPLTAERRYACLITFWSHALDSNHVLITSSLYIHPAKALEIAFEGATTFEPTTLLHHSLLIFGFMQKRQLSVNNAENVNRFKEHFGVSPITVAAVLNDLKQEYSNSFKVKDALMTFHWLKCYGTERTLSGPWNVGCLQSIRDTCKLYAKNIGSLKKYKIVFGPFEEGDVLPYAVDGVHYSTSEYYSCLTFYYVNNMYLQPADFQSEPGTFHKYQCLVRKKQNMGFDTESINLWLHWDISVDEAYEETSIKTGRNSLRETYDKMEHKRKQLKESKTKNGP